MIALSADTRKKWMKIWSRNEHAFVIAENRRPLAMLCICLTLDVREDRLLFTVFSVITPQLPTAS